MRRLFFAALVCGFCNVLSAMDLDKLGENDVKLVNSILARTSQIIKERRARGTLTTLDFDELYRVLDSNERSFAQRFVHMDANAVGVRIPYVGIATGQTDLAAVRGQKIHVKGRSQELPTVFLASQAYEQYKAMMAEMEKDIHKRLYIQSGYRSSAYQLWLFLNSLRNHRYSVRETAKSVALPGYSEHGNWQKQAMDLVSAGGVDCDHDPNEFESLAEYKWMLRHAAEFGFVLSYPRGAGEGIGFEPWHWRYEGKSEDKGHKQ